MALTADQITAKNFKEFYDRIYPYLNGAAHAGFTPIGTIITYMGTTAPQNYLACDDTAYNIADYPELAAFFEAQFGSVNYFGGDGTTTFKCPDLRGEFLRGTGTNLHENQGSGASVGVHQDGTVINNVAGSDGSGNGLVWYDGAFTNSNDNRDTSILASSSNTGTVKTTKGPTSMTEMSHTSRPTNTSVLYCIAYKDIYVDARYDYRTTEKVVGTWVDGKPVYQNTIELTAGTTTADGTVSTVTEDLSALIGNFDKFVDSSGILLTADGDISPLNGYMLLDNTVRSATYWMSYRTKFLYLRHNRTSYNGALVYITLRYTKTTD